MKNKNLLICLAVIGLIIVSALTWKYYTKKDIEIIPPDSVKVEVEEIRRGSISNTLSTSGRLSANNTVVIKPLVRGVISEVLINGGEEVAKGDLLFKINDRSFQLNLKEAKALYKLSKAQYERVKKLSQQNFSAAKKLEEAKAHFSKQKVQYKKAQEELKYTSIVAPYEGIINLHNVSVGTSVSGDMELVTITDVDPIKVNFKIPAKYLENINIGQEIKIFSPNNNSKKFTGIIEGIDPIIDPSAQMVAVRARIDNSDKRLKPGAFVKIHLVVGSKDDCLMLSESSVIVSGDRSYVWGVWANTNKPGEYVSFSRGVIIGLKEEGSVEITGLTEGDVVVANGHHKITERVRIRFDKDGLSENNTLGIKIDDLTENSTTQTDEVKTQADEINTKKEDTSPNTKNSKEQIKGVEKIEKDQSSDARGNEQVSENLANDENDKNDTSDESKQEEKN